MIKQIQDKQQAKRAFKDASYGQLEGLAAETRMSIANTSQHLQVLQGARLVETSKDGRYVFYRPADALVSDFFRSFRLLAEDRLAEVQQIRRRFFNEDGTVVSVDRENLLQRVRQNKAVVIDVRPTEEYVSAHIAGSLPIPLAQLEKRLKELPRSKEIVAYCRGPFCVLAQEAVELLRSHGFRASRLEDSVQDWLAHGLPVTKGDGASKRLTRALAEV